MATVYKILGQVNPSATTTGTVTVSTVGSYTVYKFTDSGTISW